LPPPACIFRFCLFRVGLVWNSLRRLRTRSDIVSGLFGSIFGLAKSILHFACGLLRGALHLHLRVIRPFAHLPLDASRDDLHSTFFAVLVHLFPPLKSAELMAFPAVPEFSCFRQSSCGSADLGACRDGTAARPDECSS